MELIRQNPYHVIGILAGANQRTIAKQKAKINAFQKVGKSIEFDTDLEFIGNPDRSNGAVEKAFANIEINQNKLFNALFWFANNNHLDETALNYLQSGDLEKAEEIWQKVTTGKEVSSKNFTAYNNLGSLKLATAFENGSIDMENLKEAVRLKTELLISDSFNDFCHLVADETYTVDQDKELEAFVNALLEEVNKSKNSEAKKIPAQIGSIHPKIKSLVSEKLTDTPLHNIERKTEQTKKARNENPENGLQLARKLYQETKSDLTTLSELLGKADLKYKMVADKLAKELLQCGIDYFKDLQDNDHEINELQVDDVVQVFDHALSVAVGEPTKERISENSNAIKEFKNREIYILIHLLDQIIEVYEKTGYDFATGQVRSVDSKKVIGFLKDKMTDDTLQKAALIGNEDILHKLVSRIEKVFTNIGRSQYTYSRAKFLSNILSEQEGISRRLDNLAIEIKPNVASVAASADDATGGCLGEIVGRIIGLAIILFIIWLLATIFS